MDSDQAPNLLRLMEAMQLIDEKLDRLQEGVLLVLEGLTGVEWVDEPDDAIGDAQGNA